MKNTLIILFILITICSCTSSQNIVSIEYSNAFESIFDEFKKNNGNLYIGISGPYTNKREASKVALENAVKMASLAQHLSVRSDIDLISISDSNSSKEKFKVYSEAVYDSSVMKEIIESMRIKEIRWFGGKIGAVAFIEYGNKDSVDWDHSKSWIKDGIKIPGYITAIGIAEEYYYIQDSLEAAAFEGAISLLDFHDGTVSAVSEHVDTFNESMNVDSYQINMNFLNGFTVLDYYYDPGKRVFYSLVAVKE